MRYENIGQQARNFSNMAFAPSVGRCLGRSLKSETYFENGNLQTIKSVIDPIRSTLNLASDDVIERITLHNPDIVKIIYNKRWGHERGLFSYLPLNMFGALALANDRFNSFDPDVRMIAKSGEKAEAIYIWLAHLPNKLGQSVSAIVGLYEAMGEQDCPIFSRGVTAHSQRLHKTVGFTQAQSLYPDCADDLLVVLPQSKPVARKTDTTIRLVRTLEDYTQMAVVRAATYVAEQYCLYEEEFDGNDLCSTHFLGMINGDAAGCIRVRFFAGFAKIERLAVRSEYRKSRLAYQLVRAAIEHCKRKGYRTLYGHSRLDLVRFWSVFGFRVRDDRPGFDFADVRYIEMVAHIDMIPDAISLDNDPMMLIRPEGAWDEPGPFDRCQKRALDRSHLIAQSTRTVGKAKISA
jgi:predicted GNAT family N-acyltransferase